MGLIADSSVFRSITIKMIVKQDLWIAIVLRNCSALI